MKSGTPKACPACGTELYPVARLRPQARPSRAANLLMVIGVLASAAIFIGGAFWFRFIGGGRRGGGILGMLTLLPALVPGLVMGRIASLLPKSLTLKCPRCTWRGRYRIGRDGHAVPVDPSSASAFEQRGGAASANDAALEQMEHSPPTPAARTRIVRRPIRHRRGRRPVRRGCGLGLFRNCHRPNVRGRGRQPGRQRVGPRSGGRPRRTRPPGDPPPAAVTTGGVRFERVLRQRVQPGRRRYAAGLVAAARWRNIIRHAADGGRDGFAERV
jgi:hypothetical protein